MQVDLMVTATADEQDSHFQGEVTVSGAAFLYDLRFVVPITKYMDAVRGKTTAEFRKMIDIRVRANGVELQLEDDEWRMFYYLLIGPVLKIHNNRVLLRKEGKTTGKVVLSEGGIIVLKLEGVHILARPKFNCQLMSAVPDSQRKPN